MKVSTVQVEEGDVTVELTLKEAHALSNDLDGCGVRYARELKKFRKTLQDSMKTAGQV